MFDLINDRTTGRREKGTHTFTIHPLPIDRSEPPSMQTQSYVLNFKQHARTRTHKHEGTYYPINISYPLSKGGGDIKKVTQMIREALIDRSV